MWLSGPYLSLNGVFKMNCGDFFRWLVKWRELSCIPWFSLDKQATIKGATEKALAFQNKKLWVTAFSWCNAHCVYFKLDGLGVCLNLQIFLSTCFLEKGFYFFFSLQLCILPLIVSLLKHPNMCLGAFLQGLFYSPLFRP